MRNETARYLCFALVGAMLESPPPASAQQCAGLSSFAGRPVQLFLAGLFHEEGNGIHGGLAAGGARPFGGLEIGAKTFDEFNSTLSWLGGDIGYQVPVAGGTVQVCPVAQATFTHSSEGVFGPGTHLSEFDAAIGLSAGVVALRFKTLELVPTASAGLAHHSNEPRDDVGNSVPLPEAFHSAPSSFGRVDVGVGFVFNRQVSIRPLFSLPMYPGASKTFGLRVAANLGARH